MNALNIPIETFIFVTAPIFIQSNRGIITLPSLAPVVMVTSVSGFIGRLKASEYTSAIAFFKLLLPYTTGLVCFILL